MKRDVLSEKSFDFAVRITRLSVHLQSIIKEYVLSKQLLRSGTSVGAMIREARFAQSRADFINKFSIALKECNETQYWLMLLTETEMISKAASLELVDLSDEIISLLVATIKKLKAKQ